MCYSKRLHSPSYMGHNCQLFSNQRQQGCPVWEESTSCLAPVTDTSRWLWTSVHTISHKKSSASHGSTWCLCSYIFKRVIYWERRNRGYTQKWTSLKTQLETAARGATCITAGMPWRDCGPWGDLHLGRATTRWLCMAHGQAVPGQGLYQRDCGPWLNQRIITVGKDHQDDLLQPSPYYHYQPVNHVLKHHVQPFLKHSQGR